jgi:hypothetical protein
LTLPLILRGGSRLRERKRRTQGEEQEGGEQSTANGLHLIVLFRADPAWGLPG